jgi:hypothetical protein
VAFLTQNKAKFCKNSIKTLVFEKSGNFFAINCGKSQKIVIITSANFQFDPSGELRLNFRILVPMGKLAHKGEDPLLFPFFISTLWKMCTPLGVNEGVNVHP